MALIQKDDCKSVESVLCTPAVAPQAVLIGAEQLHVIAEEDVGEDPRVHQVDLHVPGHAGGDFPRHPALGVELFVKKPEAPVSVQRYALHHDIPPVFQGVDSDTHTITKQGESKRAEAAKAPARRKKRVLPLNFPPP